jgi:hypothetical protein
VSLAVDPFHNTYVVDAGANELVKLGASGAVLQRSGGPGWGHGSLDRPSDVAATGLDVYVADYGNHRVIRLDRDLGLQGAGTNAEGEEGASDFGYPRSVAVTRFGDLLVVDGENRRVMAFARDGADGKPFGDFRAGKGALGAPVRVRVTSSDRVVVQDSAALVMFDIFGNYMRTLGRDMFPALRSFAVDGKNLYVLDGCSIVILDGEGILRSRFTIPTTGHWPPCGEIVDFQVDRDRIILLSAHAVRMEPLPSPER